MIWLWYKRSKKFTYLMHNLLFNTKSVWSNFWAPHDDLSECAKAFYINIKRKFVQEIPIVIQIALRKPHQRLPISLACTTQISKSKLRTEPDELFFICHLSKIPDALEKGWWKFQTTIGETRHHHQGYGTL